MASSLPAASASAPATAQISSSSQRCFHHSKLSFSPSPRSKLCSSTKASGIKWNRSAVTRAQLKEVSVDGSSNASPTLEEKDAKSQSEPSLELPVSEESISEFMNQVASLVKLVDSRDIVELQLKQCNCELIIRKKEALPQPPASAPLVMMHSPSSPAAVPSHYPPTQSAIAAAPASPASSTPSAAPPAAKSPKSSLPRLKCPMAGTFYRSPGPGEPAFVKVGDKVKKGQVLCVIEAMKLMNEIEADQSGTIVEVLADDGKPVSVDTPLFVIEP